jgi:ribosomal protein L31
MRKQLATLNVERIKNRTPMHVSDSSFQDESTSRHDKGDMITLQRVVTIKCHGFYIGQHSWS